MLEFDHVTKQYHSGMFGKVVTRAVDDVSFTVGENERVGLLGESGCGKTTIARLACKLLKPTSGTIRFEGHDISKLSKSETKALHKDVQLIFQNPQFAFSPRMKLYDTIAEPLRVHGLVSSSDEERRTIDEYMDLMDLTRDIYTRYPHEISGGQAQRIAIMRIIMLEPKLVIADEPTTMLDVSVQAQILSMLKHLLDDRQTALIFVTHDLEVLHAMCDRILVIDHGQVVEEGPVDDIFTNPRNEYTKSLVPDSDILLKAHID